MTPHLTFEVHDRHTALVTLNRPEVGNALSVEMRDLLAEAWSQVAKDAAIRAVVVTGSGTRHFCTGADVGHLATGKGAVSADGRATESIIWSPVLQGVVKPVICAVNGLVAGGGLHFVADADLVFAVPDAAFMDTHTSMGLVGGVENVSLLHRLPLGSVLRMTLVGRGYRMSATRAYQLGLVDELVDPDRLLEVALQTCAEIAKNSPTAITRSKQLLWQASGMSHQQAAEYAWTMARLQLSHPDAREGAAAYSARRPARWSE